MYEDTCPLVKTAQYLVLYAGTGAISENYIFLLWNWVLMALTLFEHAQA